ncbi:MAG: hypothetical protein MJZ63_02505 [Muribaculaceae bacterium]|nr:hypothetical protein [Muribaculaceae bacterium]
MKNLVFAFIALFIGIAFASCNKSNSNPRLDAFKDSIRRADSLKQIQRDAEKAAEKIHQDSIDYLSFTSQDLKTFFLKGHVKSVTETTAYGEKTTLLFDINGNLTNKGGFDEVKRNSKGQITDLINKDTWDGGDEGATYTYNGNGYPKSYSYWVSDTYMEQYTKYNSSNWPIAAKQVYDFPEGEEPRGTITYSNTDHMGNWTKKKVAYKSFEDSYPSDAQVTTRNIPYYTFEEVYKIVAE